MTFTEHEILVALNRDALIYAHRQHDEETAKLLSQQKEKLKTFRYCLDCGVRISATRDTNGCRPVRCTMHANIHRFYPRAIAA